MKPSTLRTLIVFALSAIVTAAVFVLINYLLTVLAGRVERRLRSRGHTSAKAIPVAPGEAPAMTADQTAPTAPARTGEPAG